MDTRKFRRTTLRIITITSILLVFSAALSARDAIDVYPYADPYLATMTAVLLRADRNDAKIAAARSTNFLTLMRDRGAVKEIEGVRELVFKVYRQPGPAPLIYVLGGIGANVFSSVSRYTADALFRDGFHVIVLPSPFNWNFTLTASRSALPGVTDEDAVDIYNTMKATLSAVEEQYGIVVTRLGAVGFSLGALQLGWISEVDRIDGSLELERFLLVNPPIDLVYAAQRIEELRDAGVTIPPKVRQRLISYAFGFVLQAWEGDMDDLDYFIDLDKRFKVNDAGIKFLIGYAMQLALDDVISVSELLNRRNIVDVPSPLAASLLGNAKNQSYTFGRYLNEVLLPVWAERLDIDDPLPALRARADLLPILDKLGANSEVYLMHNDDDFIVNGEHLARVTAALGDRAIIYPSGGHLGNLWFPPHRARLLEIFADLKN